MADQLGRPVASSRSAPTPPSSWAGGSSSSTAAGGCSRTPRAEPARDIGVRRRGAPAPARGPRRRHRPGHHPPTWTCSQPPCPSSATGARSVRWRSSRASRPSTTRFARTWRWSGSGTWPWPWALASPGSWPGHPRPLHALADAARRMAGATSRGPQEAAPSAAGRGGAFLQRDGGPLSALSSPSAPSSPTPPTSFAPH